MSVSQKAELRFYSGRQNNHISVFVKFGISVFVVLVSVALFVTKLCVAPLRFVALFVRFGVPDSVVKLGVFLPEQRFHKTGEIRRGKQNFVFGERGFFGIDKKRRKDVFYRIKFGVISGICAFVAVRQFQRMVGIEILPEIDIFTVAEGIFFLYKFVVEKRRLIKASPKIVSKRVGQVVIGIGAVFNRIVTGGQSSAVENSDDREIFFYKIQFFADETSSVLRQRVSVVGTRFGIV